MLGVELGTGPWGPLFSLQGWGVAIVLLCPNDIFSQEEVLLGSLVRPKCFFEVSDIWGRGRCLHGRAITVQAQRQAAVGWRESLKYFFRLPKLCPELVLH